MGFRIVMVLPPEPLVRGSRATHGSAPDPAAGHEEPRPAIRQSIQQSSTDVFRISASGRPGTWPPRHPQKSRDKIAWLSYTLCKAPEEASGKAEGRRAPVKI